MRLTALGRSLPLHAAGHVEQTERLARIGQDGRDAFTGEQLRLLAEEGHHLLAQRCGPRSKTDAPPTGPIGLSRSSIGISWAGGRTSTTAPLSLPLYWASSSAVAAFSDDDVGLHLAVGPRHPAPRGDGERNVVFRLDEAERGRAALPHLRQLPRLLVDVAQPIRLHLVGGPLVGPLEVFGAGQARPNLIA